MASGQVSVSIFWRFRYKKWLNSSILLQSNICRILWLFALLSEGLRLTLSEANTGKWSDRSSKTTPEHIILDKSLQKMLSNRVYEGCDDRVVLDIVGKKPWDNRVLKNVWVVGLESIENRSKLKSPVIKVVDNDNEMMITIEKTCDL